MNKMQKTIVIALCVYGCFLGFSIGVIHVFCMSGVNRHLAWMKGQEFLLDAQDQYALHFTANSSKEASLLLEKAVKNLKQHQVEAPSQGRFLLLIFTTQQYLLCVKDNRVRDANVILENISNEFSLNVA